MSRTVSTLRLQQQRTHPYTSAGLSVLLTLAAVTGTAAILLEHGFYHPPVSLWLLRTAQVAVALVMAAERVGRWGLSRFNREYLRTGWQELALAAATAVLAATWTLAGVRFWGQPAWQVLMQGYILANLAIRATGLAQRAADVGVSPARLFVGSFVFLILLGTGLLRLPRAVPPNFAPLKFEDALFTSTSATCVTGLVVLDTGTQLSRFGQVVVLCLIQTGGLGLLIFGTVFVMVARRGLGIRRSAVMGELVAEERLGLIARMVKFIFLSTILIELIGAALLWPLWRGEDSPTFWAVFHSVAAFCNAGFGLAQQNLVPWRNTWQVQVVVTGLIILGGLGFPVLYDLAISAPRIGRYLWRRLRWRVPGVARPQLTLHTRLVLVTTAALLVGGTGGLLLIEPWGLPTNQVEHVHKAGDADALARLTDWQRTGMGGQYGQRVAQAWFTSVTARTAGFNTINMDELTNGGKLWVTFLMIIGGSPASTAGGMKTVTLAVVLLLIWSALRRREVVEAFGRTISHEVAFRAACLAALYLMLVAASTIALSVAQRSGQLTDSAEFVNVLFESASACGTVGLSTGLTPLLTVPAKYVIILSMLIGRVGPLTLLLSVLVIRPLGQYRYPKENVVIG